MDYGICLYRNCKCFLGSSSVAYGSHTIEVKEVIAMEVFIWMVVLILGVVVDDGVPF